MNYVYLVFSSIDSSEGNEHLVGVFASEDSARKRCVDTAKHHGLEYDAAEEAWMKGYWVYIRYEKATVI